MSQVGNCVICGLGADDCLCSPEMVQQYIAAQNNLAEAQRVILAAAHALGGEFCDCLLSEAMEHLAEEAERCVAERDAALSDLNTEFIAHKETKGLLELAVSNFAKRKASLEREMKEYQDTNTLLVERVWKLEGALEAWEWYDEARDFFDDASDEDYAQSEPAGSTEPYLELSSTLDASWGSVIKAIAALADKES